jgi:CDP-diacylglycerol--serine O-phosphatidyltransferase
VRGIYVLPNLFTAANLAFGFAAIALMTVDEPANLEKAAWLVLFANVFDAMDGRVARWMKVSSQFGEEFDSLADMVSFGVAPACLMLKLALRSYGTAGFLVAMLFCVCGALRLARFNVIARSPKPPTYFFVGCPIPAAATFLCACALTDLNNAMALPDGFYLAMTLLTSGLMVSTLPYPSMKKSEGGPRRLYVKAAFLGIVLMALFTYKQDFIFAVAALYLLSGIVWKGAREVSRLTGFLQSKRGDVTIGQPGH